MFLVKYNELFLKSAIVKKKMLDKLVNNISVMGKNLKIKKLPDSLIVDGEKNLAIETLKRTFGIHSFSEAVECERDIDEIKEKSKEIASRFVKKTFRITAMRSDKSFEYTSRDLENTYKKDLVDCRLASVERCYQ